MVGALGCVGSHRRWQGTAPPLIHQRQPTTWGVLTRPSTRDIAAPLHELVLLAAPCSIPRSHCGEPALSRNKLTMEYKRQPLGQTFGRSYSTHNFYLCIGRHAINAA